MADEKVMRVVQEMEIIQYLKLKFDMKIPRKANHSSIWRCEQIIRGFWKRECIRQVCYHV